MKTDVEFMAMLGSLTPDEESALKESIAREGVREPVTLWAQKVRCNECEVEAVPAMNEYDEAICGNCSIEFSPDYTRYIIQNAVLVDGYNRYRIAKELGKPLRYRLVHFADREEAKRWIAQNQLGRRNLSEAKRAYCLGLLYNAEKRDVGRPEKPGNSYQIIAGTTAEKLAENHGVSEKTVRNAGEFAESVDAVESVLPGTREKALSGDVTRRQVSEAAREVRQGNTEAARAALDKGCNLRDRIKQDLQEKKQKDLANMPIHTRAKLLLDVCDVCAAIEALVSLIPQDEKLREITEAIKLLRDMSIELQRGA